MNSGLICIRRMRVCLHVNCLLIVTQIWSYLKCFIISMDTQVIFVPAISNNLFAWNASLCVHRRGIISSTCRGWIPTPYRDTSWSEKSLVFSHWASLPPTEINTSVYFIYVSLKQEWKRMHEYFTVGQNRFLGFVSASYWFRGILYWVSLHAIFGHWGIREWGGGWYATSGRRKISCFLPGDYGNWEGRSHFSSVLLLTGILFKLGINVTQGFEG